MLLTAEDVNRKRNRPFTLSALKFPAVRVISAVIRFNWNESEARRSRREVGHQSESQIKFRGFAARSTSACWTSHSSSFPSTVRELKEDGRHTYTAHVELIGSVTRLWPVILRKLRHCNVSERFVCLFAGKTWKLSDHETGGRFSHCVCPVLWIYSSVFVSRTPDLRGCRLRESRLFLLQL